MTDQTTALIEKKSLTTARILTFIIFFTEAIAFFSFNRVGFKQLPQWPYATLSLIGMALWIFTVLKPKLSLKASQNITFTCLFMALAVATHQNLFMYRDGQMYQPFLGHKFIALAVGIMAPSLQRKGILLISLCGIIPVGMYYLLIPVEARRLIFRPEPWTTFMAAVVGMTILYHRMLEVKFEIAAIEATYAKKHAEHRTSTFLAIRDFVSTPLQTLILEAAILRKKFPQASADLDRLDGSIEKILELRKKFDEGDTAVSANVSIDANHVIESLRSKVGGKGKI
ncbi:MAG: hypothetical protein A4S09_15395 [Proteobacteria bacterium SG_bin7]|nr:MAG: hypothetical protein A4S09_15395 [Proteobacteria bacterium SG_bin7]